MDRKGISGWRDVFSFTFKQQVKGKSFKLATVLIGAVFFLALLLLMLISGKLSQDQEEIVEESNISHVYILDELGLLDDINRYLEADPDRKKSFGKINFTYLENQMSVEDAMNQIGDKETHLLIQTKRQTQGILLEALLPDNTAISTTEGEGLLNNLIPLMEMNKIEQAGLSQEELIIISRPAMVTISTVGEKAASFGEEMIKYLVPMFFSFILYIMLLLYGQIIMKSLMIEKTSKLMEMLLTTLDPKAIITGKILAMSIVAVLQFLFWILSGVGGFIVGNELLKSKYPGYENPVSSLLELVKANTGGMAFSIQGIILSLIALYLGFLLYSVYAGVIGSSLSKAEDLSSGVAFFQLPVIFCGMAAMLLPTMSEGFWPNFINYFPFTSPFLLPANILNGNMNLLPSIISLLILIGFIALLSLLSGKLYKGLIFYKGDKLKLKNIILTIKGLES